MRTDSVEERKSQSQVDALIEENLRLVLKIANDFLGRGLAWDDLVSEGNRGLITAAERFDASRGARFSTYSAWWIKQAIRQAIADHATTVRVPIGTQLNSNRIKRAVRDLTAKLDRPPTDEEVATEAKLPLVTVQRLRDTRQVDMQSLNAQVHGDDSADGTELLNLMADNDSEAPDEMLIRVEEIEQLLKLLDRLSPRERKILRMRFGLDGEVVRTLDEVGEELHCSNERVRQLQNRALHKLQDMMVKYA
jgi:RNA polymerase primary sigma factor